MNTDFTLCEGGGKPCCDRCKRHLMLLDIRKRKTQNYVMVFVTPPIVGNGCPMYQEQVKR